MKYMHLIAFLATLFSVASSEPPPRDGIALGYFTTPNSIVYRSSMSDERAMDFWLDVPEVAFGDQGELRIGAGIGYAMFVSRHDDFAFLIRPQFSFAYVEDIRKRGEIAVGATATAVAFLDHIGANNVDIYAGISLGSVAELGEDYTKFHILLTRKKPFGIVIGAMYYF